MPSDPATITGHELHIHWSLPITQSDRPHLAPVFLHRKLQAVTTIMMILKTSIISPKIRKLHLSCRKGMTIYPDKEALAGGHGGNYAFRYTQAISSPLPAFELYDICMSSFGPRNIQAHLSLKRNSTSGMFMVIRNCNLSAWDNNLAQLRRWQSVTHVWLLEFLCTAMVEGEVCCRRGQMWDEGTANIILHFKVKTEEIKIFSY